jgi:hypothetical protein
VSKDQLRRCYMIADSNSDIAWHRVQLRKNRNAVMALEIAHFRTGDIAGKNHRHPETKDRGI